VFISFVPKIGVSELFNGFYNPGNGTKSTAFYRTVVFSIDFPPISV